MQDLANYAKQRGVMIYFETGQETPTTLIRAIKDIATGNVFINCDLANLLMYGKANSLDAVKQFGSLIKEFHAKDGRYRTRTIRMNWELKYHSYRRGEFPGCHCRTEEARISRSIDY